MKKILFVSMDLGTGGAERFQTYLINRLSQKPSYDLHLLLLRDDRDDYMPDLPSFIHIHRLHIIGRTKYSMLKVFRTIVKLHPDICFTGDYRINILISLFLPLLSVLLPYTKFIVREVIVLSNHIRTSTYTHWLLRLIYRCFYNLYDIIIAQSVDMKEDMINKWGIYHEKITLINNPVNIQLIQDRSLSPIELDIPSNLYNYIAIGRLERQKGLDIIIHRMHELLPSLNFRLYILGQGSQYDMLLNLVCKLGLIDYVHFLGYQSNPYAYIPKFDGLLLSSRYEGFPNVLLEANAFGIPVFSNPCPGGVSEIVRNGENGISRNFENLEEFKKGLRRFQSCKFDRNTIIDLTRSRYDYSLIMQKYEELFLE